MGRTAFTVHPSSLLRLSAVCLLCVSVVQQDNAASPTQGSLDRVIAPLCSKIATYGVNDTVKCIQ